MSDHEKTAKQVAGTMAIEGMRLSKREFALIRDCASGKKSSEAAIKEMVGKYTIK